MIPIDQTSLSTLSEPKRGNCVQAAVASILEFDINDVPNFIAITEPQEWGLHFRKFFQQHGITALRISGDFITDGYYLAVGNTNRSDDVLHMCVYFDGELAHDPHPSKAGLTKITDVYLLIPHDPSRVLKGAWYGNDW